jgi:hypothetical protein
VDAVVTGTGIDNRIIIGADIIIALAAAQVGVIIGAEAVFAGAAVKGGMVVG